jgi:hypothetical protein
VGFDFAAERSDLTGTLTDATAIDHLDATDVPDEIISEHARVVIDLWLAWSHEAKRKGDVAEARRLAELARQKINADVAATLR